MSLGFDETDYKILRELQKNGRVTNIQLSKQVGLSPAPTLERVKKLENNGVIESYHAKVNKSKVGLGINALIQVNLVRQLENAIHNFTEKIAQIPEITECYQVTGNFDYLLKAVVPDIPAFERLIGEKLGKIDEIGQMHTNVILSEVKNSPLLPLSYAENGTNHQP